MPWRAISIMPLLIAAPRNTPMEATRIMRLKEAALVPMAELRKFTASLLTPTDRSKTASKNRKMIIHKNRISIVLKNLIVTFLFAKVALKCFKNMY